MKEQIHQPVKACPYDFTSRCTIDRCDCPAGHESSEQKLFTLDDMKEAWECSRDYHLETYEQVDEPTHETFDEFINSLKV